MAGLAGIVHFDGAPVAHDLLRAVTESAAHRGPDGIFYQHAKDCGFAHLALHTGAAGKNTAPLLQHEREGRVWLLTADARIDNRSELRSSLAVDDEPVAHDDGALILSAFLKWDVACVQHLTGDFAFAIWDADNRTLFCARDALGVKPLHYATFPGGLCFASEAQQILHHPRIDYRLNEAAIAEYLAACAIDEQATFFEPVQSLAPGHTLLAKPGQITTACYWHPEQLAPSVYRDHREYAERFRSLFTLAVTDRIGDAEKAGISVSGGLDSGSVAAVAQKQLGSTRNIQGFTYVFDELKQCDERFYSQSLADELGLSIETIPIERFWLLADDDAFRPQLESPFISWASSDQFLYRRCQQSGIKVLLTGHGGDSLVGGSRLIYLDRLLAGHLGVFKDIQAHANLRNRSSLDLVNRYLLRPLIPRPIKAAARNLLPWPDPSIPPWIDSDFAARMQLSRRLRARNATQIKAAGLARRERIDDMRHLSVLGSHIYYQDRTACGFGVECRHPFLDRRLVEYTLSLPDDQLFKAGLTKLILRTALHDTLPPVIRGRKDKGIMDAFIDTSLRSVSADKISALLDDAVSGTLGFVDAARLQNIWEHYRTGASSISGAWLWYPITLEAWLRSFAPKKASG